MARPVPDPQTPAPGWIGGFAQSNPAFAYPDPDLSSLPFLGNLDNLALLQRQQGVRWPEFSWEVEPGNGDSRCFQMFAPYISRLGYDAAGRVYSIICPQQGIWLKDELCLNVEVTVTGQRGWADEDSRELAADMGVEGRIWFTAGEHLGTRFRDLARIAKLLEPSLPLDKAHAIRVRTHLPGDPGQPHFPVVAGTSDLFESPDFARHPEAWTTGNLAVEIGTPAPTHVPVVDAFNRLVMDAFNLGSGNMLRAGNVLAWNLWFSAPQLVHEAEWASHAARWRHSIDAHHGSPTGSGSTARYFDGTPFDAEASAVEEVLHDIERFLREHVVPYPHL